MRLLNEDQTADLEVSPETLRLTGRAVTDMRGVGIASIAKTATSGLVDTYTITYTDGRTQTYEVTNGAEGPRGPRGDKGPRGYTGFSAYQYAVAGGYEGTEEEFTQLMASNATMAETVEYYSWTEEIKTALMDCFENVAWVNPDGQTYYDALYAALYDRTRSITNTLTGCRNTNGLTAITKGRPYNAVLEKLPGYTMDGAVVTITMGGEDVSNYYSSGTISIPSVTGNVVITATAAAVVPIAISAVYTQSGTVYDSDSLDVLKADLVVTAEYADSTSAVVTDYTLSGDLSTASSTITVTYQGLTDTFTVAVTLPVFDYKASRDGLLSAQTGINKYTNNASYFSETISAAGNLILTGTNSGTANYLQFKIGDNPTTGVWRMRIRAEIYSIGTTGTGPFSLRPSLSDGSAGVRFGFCKQGTTASIAAVEGSAASRIIKTGITMGSYQWHDIDCYMNAGTPVQTIAIDGEEILNSSSLATAAKNNSVFLIGQSTVYIDTIKLYNA